MRTFKVVVSCGFLAMASMNVAADPYVGVQLGHEDFGFDFIDKEPGFGDLKAEGLSASGYSGGVYGGLRFGEDARFFAVELNVSGSNAAYKESFEGSETTIDVKNSYGLGFLFGTTVNKAKLYGLLGAQRTDFKIDDSIGTDNTDDEQPWGYRVGIGAEFPLDDMMAIRAGWNRTFYGEIENESPFSDRQFTYEPEQSQFHVGLTVAFK